MAELTPVCALTDVELYLHADVPANLTEYVERKIGASGIVLRRLMRNEGKGLDTLINPTSPDYDQLTYEQARERHLEPQRQKLDALPLCMTPQTTNCMPTTGHGNR